MTTAHTPSPASTPRFWLKEALVVIAIVAFGVFVLALPPQNPSPARPIPVPVALID
jgi:hypothetical protein